MWKPFLKEQSSLPCSFSIINIGFSKLKRNILAREKNLNWSCWWYPGRQEWIHSWLPICWQVTFTCLFTVLFFILFSWSKIMGGCLLFFQRTESHSAIGNYLAPPCYFLDYKVLEHHIWNLKLTEIQNLIQPCKWHHLSQILLSFQSH